VDKPLVERRFDARFGQPVIAGMQAILRPGYAVTLIDLSSGGALIEGPRPLRPGARVHFQLTIGERRLGLGAHVLRCAVASLDSRVGVLYRGALKFDHRCDVLWEQASPSGYLVPADPPFVPGTNGQGLTEDHRDSDRTVEREKK
jgi:hypothetical protein